MNKDSFYSSNKNPRSRLENAANNVTPLNNTIPLDNYVKSKYRRRLISLFPVR